MYSFLHYLFPLFHCHTAQLEVVAHFHKEAFRPFDELQKGAHRLTPVQEDLIAIRVLKIKPLYARPWAEQLVFDFVDFNSLAAELLVGCGNV